MGNRKIADVGGLMRAVSLLGSAILTLSAAAASQESPDRKVSQGGAPATPPGLAAHAPPPASTSDLNPLPDIEIPKPTLPRARPAGAMARSFADSPSLLIRPGTAPAPAVGPSSMIDLPRVLQLGRANNLTIALARNRIASAEVGLKQAQFKWLPDLQFGTNYLLHDGLVQRAPGEIINAHKQSLFVGGGPMLRWQLNETIMLPRIARSLIRASAAAEAATVNDTLLLIVERYFDLLAAYSYAEIAHEAMENAEELARLTEEFERAGAGLPSDTARARTELDTRRQQLELSAERIAVASVMLAQPLLLDPTILLIPAESSVFPIALLPTDCPAKDLIAVALRSRPELAENQAMVDVALDRFTQTKLHPVLPRVEVGFTSGGFGGGATGFPGGMDARFGGRDDFAAAALWEIRGFGLGELAARRQGRVQIQAAELRLNLTINEVMAEVAAAQKAVESRRRQIGTTQSAVSAASRSYQLNRTRIEGGAGLPIETLQSIQALERARNEYMNAVTSFNKAQFRLLTAMGTTPATPAGAPPDRLPTNRTPEAAASRP